MESAARARQGLAIYFAVLLLSGTPFWIGIAKHGLLPDFFVPLVWTPALASLVARLMLREGFADISFRFGKGTPAGMLLGIVYPIAVALPAYGIAWSTGMAELSPATAHPLGFEIPGHSPAERLLISGIIAVTAVPIVMSILAVGEEMGWRGYMLTRLVAAKVPHPTLVSGTIWGLWHAPLILTGHYATTPKPLLAVVVFAITFIGFGSFIAEQRLSTGSIWAPVVTHAMWNSILVAFFGASTKGEQAGLWTGESGILVALSTAIVTYLFVRLRQRSQKPSLKAEPSNLDIVRSSAPHL